MGCKNFGFRVTWGCPVVLISSPLIKNGQTGQPGYFLETVPRKGLRYRAPSISPQKGATLFRSICVCIGQSVLVDEGRIAGLGLAFRVYEAFVILNP